MKLVIHRLMQLLNGFNVCFLLFILFKSIYQSTKVYVCAMLNSDYFVQKFLNINRIFKLSAVHPGDLKFVTIILFDWIILISLNYEIVLSNKLSLFSIILIIY